MCVLYLPIFPSLSLSLSLSVCVCVCMYVYCVYVCVSPFFSHDRCERVRPCGCVSFYGIRTDGPTSCCTGGETERAVGESDFEGERN